MNHVYVFVDRANARKACVLFERRRQWQLCSLDLDTKGVVRGQWLTKTQIRPRNCVLYRGLFLCNYLNFAGGYSEHTVLSRSPYFTAWAHFSASAIADMYLVEKWPPTVAVRGEGCSVRTPLVNTEDWTVWGASWKGPEHQARKRGVKVLRPGVDVSTKPAVAPDSGQGVRVEKGKVFVDEVLVIDWTEEVFQRVAPPADYFTSI